MQIEHVDIEGGRAAPRAARAHQLGQQRDADAGVRRDEKRDVARGSLELRLEVACQAGGADEQRLARRDGRRRSVSPRGCRVAEVERDVRLRERAPAGRW